MLMLLMKSNGTTAFIDDTVVDSNMLRNRYWFKEELKTLLEFMTSVCTIYDK